MLNNPRIQALAVFLITVMFALGMLFIVANPFQPAPLPSPTAPVDACTSDPALCYTPFIEPTATMRPLDPQCGRNGESYEVRYTQPVALAPSEYATYTSPDGHSLFYKVGDDLFISKDGSEGVKVGSDPVYTDIVGRVIWSPNSRYVMMTPMMDNHPLLVDAEAGTSTVLTEVQRAIDFQGWSPDGNSFLFGNNDYRTSSIWSAETGKATYSTQNTLQSFKWSPDGQWLAYLWLAYVDNGAGTRYGVTLAAADGSAEYGDVLIEPSENSIYDQFDLQPMFWAADSQFVALRSYTQANDDYVEKLIVLNTDGKILTDETPPFKLVNPEVPRVVWDIHWMPDGTRFSFARLTGENQFTWMVYDAASQQVTPLQVDLTKPPFYSPLNQHVGLYRRSNDVYSIALTDPEHTQETPFIDEATDAGDPDWSPDETWVAAVWAVGEGDTRRVKLSWMHPNGTERHDLDADFKDVRELRWLAGGRKLAYIAWRGEAGNSIETVDVNTGERDVLASGLSSMENPAYDTGQDTLTFWWQLADGRYGKDVYDADGTQVQHFFAAGDYERSRQEFWSPDGSVVALKLGALPYRGLYDQMLVLAYKDGRPPVVARSGLDGLGDPLWSPDSRQLVFTQWIQGSSGNTPPALYILSSSGKVIWFDWDFELTGIEWRRC